MSRILFDFECEDSHVTEQLVSSDTTVSTCRICSKPAARKMPAPRTKLDAISGDFPGATEKWIKTRENHMKHERKLEANHGPDAVWDRNKGL